MRIPRKFLVVVARTFPVPSKVSSQPSFSRTSLGASTSRTGWSITLLLTITWLSVRRKILLTFICFLFHAQLTPGRSSTLTLKIDAVTDTIWGTSVLILFLNVHTLIPETVRSTDASALFSVTLTQS